MPVRVHLWQSLVRMSASCGLFVAGLLLLAGTAGAQPEADPPAALASVEDLAKKVRPSVVVVMFEGREGRHVWRARFKAVGERLRHVERVALGAGAPLHERRRFHAVAAPEDRPARRAEEPLVRWSRHDIGAKPRQVARDLPERLRRVEDHQTAAVVSDGRDRGDVLHGAGDV